MRRGKAKHTRTYRLSGGNSPVPERYGNYFYFCAWRVWGGASRACRLQDKTDRQLLSDAQRSHSKKSAITVISVPHRLIRDPGHAQTQQNSKSKIQLEVDYEVYGLPQSKD